MSKQKFKFALTHFYVGMMNINTPKILTYVKEIFRDPDINFLGNGKFQNPQFPEKFFVPISREETLAATLLRSYAVEALSRGNEFRHSLRASA